MARRNTRGDDLAAASANPPQHIPSGARADIAVLFPGLRPRHDGWTQARTQRFLDTLAYTGCVKDAARVSGMSAVGARRMRRRFPLFDAAWDAALERGQQGLIAIAYQRAVEGHETVIIRKGEEYERRIAPSDAMLSLLVKRGDMAGFGGRAAASEEAITFGEWRQHKRFDERGQKIVIEDPDEASAKFIAKMSEIRARLNEYAARGGACPMCKQALPEGWPNQSMAELIGQGIVHPDALWDE